jgi:hypothetical protein
MVRGEAKIGACVRDISRQEQQRTGWEEVLSMSSLSGRLPRACSVVDLSVLIRSCMMLGR